MSKPLVTFAVAERTQIDHLEAAFSDHAAAYAERTSLTAALPTVGVGFPATELVNAAHVQVELETSNVDDYPITERAQTRYVCHVPPGKRDWAENLASLTQALVYAQPGTTQVAGVHVRGGRSKVTTDPDTGNLMCWFLAEIPLNPLPV